MSTEQIVALLIAERDKIDRAIQALGATTGKRRGRPPGSKNGQPAAGEPTTRPPKTGRKKPTFSPEMREEARKRAKAMWAKRKKATKKAA
jgi:hypothetical protein